MPAPVAGGFRNELSQRLKRPDYHDLERPSAVWHRKHRHHPQFEWDHIAGNDPFGVEWG